MLLHSRLILLIMPDIYTVYSCVLPELISENVIVSYIKGTYWIYIKKHAKNINTKNFYI